MRRSLSIGRQRTPGRPLPQSFFRRPALEVAPDLLGLVVESHEGETRTAGRIVEVEAYVGPEDRAAHSFGGRRTTRNDAMFEPGGCAYVYLVYGLHHCLNVVVAERDAPEAILIRALEPLVGIDRMRERRGSSRPIHALARGPGNLTRALGIDRRHDRTHLSKGVVRILRPPPDRGFNLANEKIVRSPRIGIDYAGAWASRPWRFSLRDHPCVSQPRTRAVRAQSDRSAPRAHRPGRSSPR